MRDAQVWFITDEQNKNLSRLGFKTDETASCQMRTSCYRSPDPDSPIVSDGRPSDVDMSADGMLIYNVYIVCEQTHCCNL